MRMLRTVSLLALVSIASACSPDLRASVAAAGVFSPRRANVGDGDGPRARLGQALFFDRELSGNRDIACGTCHMPPEHATDARHLAVGQDGARLPRAAIAPFNRGAATSLLWDGRVELRDGRIVAPVPVPDGIETLLQAQVLLPLLDRHEMRGQPGDVADDGRENELAAIPDEEVEAIWSAVVQRLLAIEAYRELFVLAFPDVPLEQISIVHVAIAIAAFEQRLWELTDTAFDDYLGAVSDPGDDGALDEVARRGASLFFGEAGCARCHDGPLLSDGLAHNIGVPQIGPGRDGNPLDLGRFLVTGNDADRFAFQTPPLRNVALTAPYMHDGAYADLFLAVRHHVDPLGALQSYDVRQLPEDLQSQVHLEANEEIARTIDPAVRPDRALSEEEIGALVAFLGSLSSRAELGVPSNGGIPSSVPSGLDVDMPRFAPDTLD